MKTRVTELLGIEYPILQGGMAWVAEYHLAAAVSEAGGLGILGAGGAPAEFVREQIQKVKEATKRPFGVNLMLMNPEADEIAKIILEEGVPVVTAGAGNPGKYMAQWKEAGVKGGRVFHRDLNTSKFHSLLPPVCLSAAQAGSGAAGDRIHLYCSIFPPLCHRIS